MAEILMKAAAFVAIIFMGYLLRKKGFSCAFKDRFEDNSSGCDRSQFFRG